jgi:competence protein ComEC
MTYWIPYSFVRITLVFTSGILLGIYHPQIISMSIATGALLLTCLVFVFLAFFGKLYRLRFIPGLVGLLMIFLSGYVLLTLRTASRDPNHIIHVQGAIDYYKVVVTGYVQEKDKSWRVEGTVQTVYQQHQPRTVTGKVQLYFSKQEFPVIQYGDIFLVRGSPSLLSSPANPGEFDYKRFLTFKNIYHQQFIGDSQARWLGNFPPYEIVSYAIQFREASNRIICRYVEGEQEQAIASALVLGVTDNLDDETIHAYSATGAMHVLAVSGLHVGIIYGILVFFLRPLTKRKGGPWLLAIVSLLVLWGYAFVTGLSPSVLRAVTMFSMVALARPFRHTTNIFNILAASAFCLLLVDPCLIMSVGFQLSYLAVLGIIYLQRPIYQWWEAPTWVLDKVWQITTVSIAAQVSTFSLGLLYFHQFPVYFLFSNLLVIPLSFVVLIAGLVLLAVSAFTPLALWVGALLNFVIHLMNASVEVVGSLPFSLLEDVYITTSQSWMIMGIIICFIEMWINRDYRYLAGVLLLAIVLSATQWLHFRDMVEGRRLTVYNVNGHSAIDFMDTGKAYYIIDSSLVNNADRMRFHIRPNWLLHGIGVKENLEHQSAVKNFDGFRLVKWCDRTLLLVHGRGVRLPVMKVDYVIIAFNSISLQELAENVTFEKVILDSSNSISFTNRLLEDALNKPIFVHSVRHKGAYTATL